MNSELSARESGLERFIRLDGRFHRQAGAGRRCERKHQAPPVTLAAETGGASTLTCEGVYHHGKLVGRVTRAATHTFGTISRAGAAAVELGVPGTELETRFWVMRHRRIEESPHDPVQARRASDRPGPLVCRKGTGPIYCATRSGSQGKVSPKEGSCRSETGYHQQREDPCVKGASVRGWSWNVKMSMNPLTRHRG